MENANGKLNWKSLTDDTVYMLRQSACVSHIWKYSVHLKVEPILSAGLSGFLYTTHSQYMRQPLYDITLCHQVTGS